MIKNETDLQYLYDGERLEIILRGEIDHHSAAAFRREADALISGKRPRTVALNLEKIGFMDSSGLGFIMGRFALTQKLGATLVLKKPNKAVQKICRLAGLERMVKTEK